MKFGKKIPSNVPANCSFLYGLGWAKKLGDMTKKVHRFPSPVDEIEHVDDEMAMTIYKEKFLCNLSKNTFSILHSTLSALKTAP